MLATTPVSREKPFLYVDSSGNYNVFSPTLKTGSSGTSWSAGGLGQGNSLPISSFFIAQPSNTVAQINAALASGQNLILTPGIYQYSQPITVTNANTVVLGLGYATLVPQAGNAAITVADVDGVQVAGLLIDAGPTNSPVLFEVGNSGGTNAAHAANPTSLNDVFFRVGGATNGLATTSLQVDSGNVILDNIWAWRAAHGAEDELAGVAFHGGKRPAWDLGVGERGGVFDLRGEAAETGAEDDAHARLNGRAAADVLDGSLRPAESVQRVTRGFHADPPPPYASLRKIFEREH